MRPHAEKMPSIAPHYISCLLRFPDNAPRCAMKRRTLLQRAAALAAVLPFERIRLLAQPRDFTPQAIDLLREIAPTVLPSALGAGRISAMVDQFVVWTRGYREGVPLAHGYGHPRLVRSGPTPAPGYIAQLAALRDEARAQGGAWSSLDAETRRTILDAAFTKAAVRNLPPRATGR